MATFQMAAAPGQMGAGQPLRQTPSIEAGIGNGGHNQAGGPLGLTASVTAAAHGRLASFKNPGEQQVFAGDQVAFAEGDEANAQQSLQVLFQPQFATGQAQPGGRSPKLTRLGLGLPAPVSLCARGQRRGPQAQAGADDRQ